MIDQGAGRAFAVGSKSRPGFEHTVEVDPLGFIQSCTCEGWAWRHKCGHADKVAAILRRQGKPVARCGGCACPLTTPADDCLCRLCEATHGAIVITGDGQRLRRKGRPESERPPVPARAAGTPAADLDLYA